MNKRRGRKPASGRALRTQYYQQEAFFLETVKAFEDFRSGRLENAEREARKALRIQPGHYDTTLLLGSILSGSGRYREAMTLLREALVKRPKDPVLLFHLAGCAFNAGRLEEAHRTILKFGDVMKGDPRLMRGHRERLLGSARKVRWAIEKELSHRASRGAGSAPRAATRPERSRPPRLGEQREVPQQRPLPDLFSSGAAGEGLPASAHGVPSQVVIVPSRVPPSAAPPRAEAVLSSGTAQAPVPRPARSTSPAPSRSPVPSTPPAPISTRVPPPSPKVTIRVDDQSRSAWATGWMEDSWGDELEERDLLLEAHRIRLLSQYEELLCLPTLTGVEQFDYQIETVRKILRRLNGRALLCDEVGLGKTIEAGMVIKEYLLRGLARSVLLLVPTGLVRQWREEMSQKFGLDFVSWSEAERMPAEPHDPRLAIGSIAAARLRQNIEAFSEREWDLVIVDEAHHLRRRSTRSWALVNALRKRFFLLLTATPVHNNLMELFELVTLVRPGLLGTPGEFRRKFLLGREGRWSADPGLLRETLAEVMVRNTRSQASVALPRRFATTFVLKPLPLEAAAYRAASDYARLLYPRADVSARLGLRHLLGCAGSGPTAVAEAALRRLEGKTQDNIPPGVSPTGRKDGNNDESIEARRRLLQIVEAVGATDLESAKAQRLLEMVGSNQEQMVVFCRYRVTLGGLSAKLATAGIEHSVYHGGLSRNEKDRAIEAFRGGARVLLSTESGGEGRNLQFCRTLVNYDLPWDPMQIEQRIGRLHRIGQQRDVFVFNLVLAGTLEEELLRILEEKIHMFELIVGEVDSILGYLERREEFAEILLGLWAGSADEAERHQQFEKFEGELATARLAYEKEKSLEQTFFEDHLEA